MKNNFFGFLIPGLAFAGSLISFDVHALDVSPILDSEWGQQAPYNDMCPPGTVAGCGPIAIGQILYHYRAPEHGYGVKSYRTETLGKDLTVDYSSRTFDWANVLPFYTEDATDARRNAVADIVYQIGVAMEADYDSSTAIKSYARMLHGLQKHLHVSPDCRFRARRFYSTPEWLEMIDANLREGHPVFYRGDWKFNGSTSGHMFVIDGVNDDGLYHINLGHFGDENKFADINVLNQSGLAPGNRGVCYNYRQAAVFDCYPTPDCDIYQEHACYLEEPIVLEEDPSLREISVSTGKEFMLGAVLRHVYDQKVTITYSWALTKDGEVVSKYFNSSTYGLSGGNKFDGYRHKPVSVPVGTPDGNYSFRIFFKSSLTGGKWYPVWDNAPNNVDVVVENGVAHVTVPDRHDGDPEILIEGDITEVETWSPTRVPGRTFAMTLVNNTSNNFEGTLKLTVETDNSTYEFPAEIALYSYTSVPHHILIPKSVINLTDKNIRSISAAYVHNGETKPILGVTTGVETVVGGSDETKAGEPQYFTLGGVCVPADNLAPGVYIRRQGAAATKVIVK